MIADELSYRILQTFSLPPTKDQAAAVDVFCRFAVSGGSGSVMIMRGSAGTGKTHLAAAIVKTFVGLGQKVVLLAPTGRAAKVFSLSAGQPAFTVHRKIYRQKAFTGDMTGFNLGDNMHHNTLFVVDESSMIANGGYSETSVFGTGRLLDDLVTYIYSGHGCRLMLIGDKAQLPPVGEEESPALSAEYMSGYGLDVFDCDLDEVLRQASDSGILYNATLIRQMMAHDEQTLLPVIRLSGFADISVVSGNDLIESLVSSYSRVGVDETMVVTRSNKRANIYNSGIRAMVLDCEEELCFGDLVMVVKNNYYWTEKAVTEAAGGVNDDKAQAAGGSAAAKDGISSFLANGDRARVLRVRNIREFYGCRFADVLLQFPDYDNNEIQTVVLLDSLMSEAPSLTAEQSRRLFELILEDYMDIPQKANRMKRIKQDPYYNALQIKYAYAVTCHKAQGGQWADVYIDQGCVGGDRLTADYIHWLYTAFTRASERLFLVNWPKSQTDGISFDDD